MPRKPPPPAPIGNKRALGHGFGRPKIYDDPFIEKEASAFIDWMLNPENIWYEDFALERGYSPQRLYEWAKINPIFSETFDTIRSMQKSKLVKGGLKEDFNAGFTKFVMANACGWYEKQQISGDAANPLQFLLEKADGTSKELVSNE
jgi:hypothetical protein